MNLSEAALNALTRLIESGVEKSADKLAIMSRTRWIMQTVSVNAGTGKHLQGALSDDDQQHYGAYFSMPEGMILMLVPESSGKKIAKAYLGTIAPKMQATPNLEEVVLAEMCNVLANTVAAKFADTNGSGFLVSSPEMARGSKKYLYNELLKRFPGIIDRNLAVTSYIHMSSTSLSTDCSIFILLDEKLASSLVDILTKSR